MSHSLKTKRSWQTNSRLHADSAVSFEGGKRRVGGMHSSWFDGQTVNEDFIAISEPHRVRPDIAETQRPVSGRV